MESNKTNGIENPEPIDYLVFIVIILTILTLINL